MTADAPEHLPINEVPLGWEPVTGRNRNAAESEAVCQELRTARQAKGENGDKVRVVAHPDGTTEVWEERNLFWINE